MSDHDLVASELMGRKSARDALIENLGDGWENNDVRLFNLLMSYDTESKDPGEIYENVVMNVIILVSKDLSRLPSLLGKDDPFFRENAEIKASHFCRGYLKSRIEMFTDANGMSEFKENGYQLVETFVRKAILDPSLSAGLESYFVNQYHSIKRSSLKDAVKALAPYRLRIFGD